VRDFFEQVAIGGEGPHYYLALSGAFVIPDMCGAMESDDGRATGARNTAWFDRHMAPRHLQRPAEDPFLSGEDCWRLRCSSLHQGTTQHDQSSYSRILFTEPGPNTFHMNIINDALNIDIREFCREMAESASAWLDDAEDGEQFKGNYDKFLQRYPNGLSPYMVGTPLIT
jgi:hypothetical protein